MGNIGGFQVGKAEGQKNAVRETTEKNIKKLLVKGILKTQQECEELLAAYLSGEISFGANGLSDSEVDKFDRNNYNIIQNSYKNYKNSNKTPDKTLYIIQTGDSPLKIAENFIDKNAPDRAKKVNELAVKIQAEAQRQGLWYSFGFRIGDAISIPGNYTEKIKQMEKAGIYYSKSNDIIKDYDDITSGRKERRKNLSEFDFSNENKPVLINKVKIQTPEKIAQYKKLGKRIAGEIVSRKDLYTYDKNDVNGGHIPAPMARERILNKHITKENAAFLMLEFAESKKHSMIEYLALTYDRNEKLLTQWDLDVDKASAKPKYNHQNTKKIISVQLRHTLSSTLLVRAKELNVKGINYNKIWDIDDVKEFSKYIDDIAVKVAKAEVQKNPKINNQVNLSAFEDYKISKVQIENWRNSGKALAAAFHSTINNMPVATKYKESGFLSYFGNEHVVMDSILGNYNSKKTKDLYKHVSADNVSYLISEYKTIGDNKGLIDDLMGESGVIMSEIKEKICKPLQAQLDRYGLKVVLAHDWKDTDNTYWVNRWANEAARVIQDEIQRRSKYEGKKAVGKKGLTVTYAVEADAVLQPGRTKKVIIPTENQESEGITKIEEIYDVSGKKLYTLFYGMNKEKQEVPKTKEVHCFIDTVTGLDIYKEAGITKAENCYQNNNGKKGKFLHTLFYYEDGRVVRDYTKNGKHCRLLIKGDAKKFRTKRAHVISQPLPIKIDYTLPENLRKNETVVQNAKAFAQTLESSKSDIMRTIQNLEITTHKEDGTENCAKYKVEIDDDKYNMYAQLAMCMAENETQFGTSANAGWGRREKTRASNSDDIFAALEKNTVEALCNKKSAWSLGYTQIKFGDHIKADDVKAVFNALGITKAQDLYNNPENSAKATVAFLAILDTRLKYDGDYQSAIAACEGAVVKYNGFSLGENGNAVKNYETKPWVNHLSDADKLCYLWNQPSTLLRGDAEPAAGAYTKNIHNMMNRYKVVEQNPGQRDNVIRQRYEKVPSMTNCGPLGSIKFVSGYEAPVPEQYFELLRENTNHLSEDSKKKLMNLIENKRITFIYGITAEKIKSITNHDVDLLCKYAQYDDYQKAKQEFTKEYLESKAVKVERKYVDSKSVITLTGKRMMPNEFSAVHKRYDTGVRTSQGTIMYDFTKWEWYINGPDDTRLPVDFSKLSAGEFLALRAQRTALVRNSGGDCFQYWRKNLIESGVDVAMSPSQAEDVARCGKYKIGLGRKRKDLVEYEYKLENGKKYKKKDDKYYLDSIRAKDTLHWFENNKDKFVEVSWVNIDDNNVRQITSSDLPNLPSGYIVVWYPGPGENFKHQEGHVCITSGNGLAYADEADNLAWNNFRNGKGEQGTFKVYRLADGWHYNPATDKLEFSGG